VGDGTVFSDNPYTLTVDVTPVNDAPTSTDDTVTIDEDTPTALTLDDFGTFADVDNASIAAVKIDTLPFSGTLEYNNGSDWVPVTVDQEIGAADIVVGLLRFVPETNANGDS